VSLEDINFWRFFPLDFNQQPVRNEAQTKHNKKHPLASSMKQLGEAVGTSSS
jgi:hypothetical protein